MEILLAIGWLACAGLAAAVGKRREATVSAFMAGLIFGPLGVVAALGLDDRQMCPRCHGRLSRRPDLCPHCGNRLRYVVENRFEGPVPRTAETFPAK